MPRQDLPYPLLSNFILLSLLCLLSINEALASSFKVECPLKQARTEMVSDLPEPWWQTPQVGRLIDTRIRTIGGDKTLVCRYQAYGSTAVSVMRKLPAGVRHCVPQAEGFKCYRDNVLTQAQREAACYKHIQGRIAWNYNNENRWSDTNIKRLCRGTSVPAQPARCFKRVMFGGINWGGGTKWKWQNAIDLCEGTNNAERTIRCFQNNVRAGRSWGDAIKACDR